MASPGSVGIIDSTSEILGNFANAMPAAWSTLWILSALFSLLLATAAGYRIIHAGANRNADEGVDAWRRLFFAGLLGAVATLVDAISVTALDQASATGISYSGTVEGPTRDIMRFVNGSIQLFGAYGVISGLWISRSRRSSEEHKGAIWRVFFGVLAINYVTVLNWFGRTAGGGVETTIKTLFGG